MAIGFRCAGCGIVRSEPWRGRCPGCYGHYSIRRTVAAEGIEDGPPPRGQLVPLSHVSHSSDERISTGFGGIDRILGRDPVTGIEGIATKAGQAIQLYGAPGSGKSTLLLQICKNISKQRYKVLYVAGEESLQQIKTRADRVGKFNDHMIVLDEQDLDAIVYQVEDVEPEILVIDSIQTLCIEDYVQGSLAGMRIAAREMYKFTQQRGIGLFVVTQVNKDGNDFAGPKEVEHILDTSLFLRLDKKGRRVLECNTKNRFGLTPAQQLFSMTNEGLVEIEEEPEEPREVDLPRIIFP